MHEMLPDIDLEDVELLGFYEAINAQNGIRTTYPEEARKVSGADTDTKFLKFYHPPTGGTITVPMEVLNNSN